MIHIFGAASATATGNTTTAAVPSSALIRFKLDQNARLQKPFKLNPTTIFQKKPGRPILAKGHNTAKSQFTTEDEWEFENGEIYELIDDDDDEVGCPWEGAIIYKRNPSISHLEYCTTLERLGLGKVSSELSKSRASAMGIRVTKSVKDYPNGTPVLISVDVTRKKGKIRLDGIIRTVIALDCNRCGQPATESVYSELSIVLSEEPVQEPETIDTFMVEDFKSLMAKENDESDNDTLFDLEDHLYFPPQKKSIDISKNIRDLVHVEININALCDPMCKGLCFKCGTNLNIDTCVCETQEEKGYGPLGVLKNQRQQI